MAVNKRLLQGAAAAGELVPSEHFGVVLYEGDGSSSHSINGGKFGAGADFNGSSSYINIGNLIGGNVYTYSFWARPDSIASGVYGAMIGSASPDVTYYQEDSKLSIYNGSGSSYLTASNIFLNTTDWVNIVAVATGSQILIYRNGVLSNTFNDTPANSETIVFGKHPRFSVEYYSGLLDQVRIFTKALSSSEVSTLYAETVDTVESLDPLSEDTTDTLQVLGDSSCVATYRFENDETDLSGNYNGTGTSIQYAAGRYGQAASFNGTDSKITTNGKPLNGNTTISISFWAKNINYGNYVSILGEGGDSSTAGYRIVWKNTNDGNMSISRSDGSGNYIIADTYYYDFGVDGSDWVHCAFTVSASEVKYYKNGENVLTQSVSNSATTAAEANFGICSDPDYPTFNWSGQMDQVRLFNKTLSASEVTTLYQENSLVASYRFEGNANDDMRAYDGSATNVTYEYGLNFTPDLVWIKDRGQSREHILSDSTRGSLKEISPSASDAEENRGVYSFDTGGFSFNDGNSNYNSSGQDYVAWCLKANGGTTSSNTDGTITSTVQANTDAGFSIVKWTTNGSSSQTVGHGLGVTPEIIFFKRLDSAQDWFVETNAIDGGYDYGNLNTTAAFQDGGAAWSTRATSTTITAFTSSNNFDYIAYAFHSVEGFSKFGSYTGNSSDNGPIVETGFEPAFLMIKNASDLGSWFMYDNKRNTSNPRKNYVLANASNVEASDMGGVDFLSNGFQIKENHDDVNDTGDTYIYMAFAADPDTEQPTLASSFNIETYTGNGSSQSITGLGFSPNLVWIKDRSATRDHNLTDSIRGVTHPIYIETSAELTNSTFLTSFDADGFSLGNQAASNENGDNFVAWTWKADDNEPTIFGGPATAVYKFEDNANDVTGTYNGTASNVSYSSSGYFNKAAEFNGSSSYVDVSYNHSNTSFSWSMWVNADSLSNSYPTVIGGMNNSTNTNNGTIWMNSTKIVIHGSTLYGEVAFSFSTSTWYHVGMVYNSVANTVKAIINGQLYTPSSTTSNTFPSQNKMRIGRADADSTAWDGKIDQVRFYKGAISDIGVAELYAETVSQNDDLELGGPPEILISANANAGFSIVKWEGAGGTSKIPHGLSAAPELIINKRLSGSNSWDFWVTGATAIGWDQFLGLNRTDAAANGFNNTPFGDTAPTSTVFTVNSDSGAGIGGSGDEFISYCFHSVSGYSKIGSYTGNGGSNSITGLGFKPDFVMIKSTGSGSWFLYDSVRSVSVGDNAGTANARPYILANASGKENGATSYNVDLDSNGFSMNTSAGDLNTNGTTYIYMAFKIN